MELLRELSVLAPVGAMQLLCTPENAKQLNEIHAEKIQCGISDSRLIRWRVLEAVTPMRCTAIEQLIDPGKYDFVWFPQQSIFPKTIGGRAILTVVDLQHHRFPKNFSFAERLFRSAAYPRSINRADHLITISKQTRTEVLSYFSIDPEKVTPILLGSDAKPNEASQIQQGVEPFLYLPAATYAHKNHEAVIRAVAYLHDRGLWKWNIVLTGQMTDRWPMLRRQIERLKIDQWFQHEGFVSRDRLEWLYQHCSAVLIPSLYEGFGLPVVEASSTNKPILVSDLPIYDELGIPHACRVNFDHPGQFLEALQSLDGRVARLPKRTWRDCAIEHLELFERLASRWSRE